MELLTLDSSFQPYTLVENYEALIWSERYSRNGDFELHSTDIGNMITTLPLESYVTLRDSNVPMVVETHELGKPLRDKATIKITGRSMDTVLERRGAVNSLPPTTARTSWYIDAAKESDAAFLAMRIVIGDAAQYKNGNLVLPLTNPAVSSLDAIPELKLILPLDYVDVYSATIWDGFVSYVPGARVKYAGYIWESIAPSLNVPPSALVPASWTQIAAWAAIEIKPQNLYATALELITASHRGIKAVRPVPGQHSVGIEIYNGADLTNQIVFDARFDQIEDASYLLSKQGSTNIAYSYGPNGSQRVRKNSVASLNDSSSAPPSTEPSGLQRRVLIVDNTSDETASSPEARNTRGIIELYKYNATALFDGQVSQQVAAGFNVNYFLGDILKLVGEYGLTENVRVAEFIRSVDSTGEKAYPTFEAVDD